MRPAPWSCVREHLPGGPRPDAEKYHTFRYQNAAPSAAGNAVLGRSDSLSRKMSATVVGAAQFLLRLITPADQTTRRRVPRLLTRGRANESVPALSQFRRTDEQFP